MLYFGGYWNSDGAIGLAVGELWGPIVSRRHKIEFISSSANKCNISFCKDGAIVFDV